ncbi:hypothetical protein BD289DRAFT_206937 [Coniella lustricola]|uniref:Secreted protein n=1 Tax=Coniella lustricola TaxID=2025994 RepID=A0A2T3ACA2_9PEZI|nr:hypothetical protein BD289DRAFT_206937 [Coniella lustricola]
MVFNGAVVEKLPSFLFWSTVWAVAFCDLPGRVSPSLSASHMLHLPQGLAWRTAVREPAARCRERPQGTLTSWGKASTTLVTRAK